MNQIDLLLVLAIGVILPSLVPVALLRVPGLAKEDAWRIASVIAFFGVVAISVGSVYAGSLVLTLVGASTAFALVVTSFPDRPPTR